MSNNGISRRYFVKKLLAWSKLAAMLSVLPPSSFSEAVTAPPAEENSNYTPSCGLSLREIALKKIHHGNGRFVNPFSNAGHRKLWKYLSWKLFHKNPYKSFYDQERTSPVSIDWERVRGNKGLSITFLKHASVLIKDLDQYILIDPIFFGLFPFIKDFTPLAFDINQMPKPDHVLITHGHYDHLDKPSLGSLEKEVHVISPLGYGDVFDDLEMHRRTQLDWFDTFRRDKLKITLLPCNHWTMRNPLVGPNRSLWGSYLINTASGPTIFIGGDTAYFDGFRELGAEFSIDLAIFNLGAYEPRWFMASSHMNPREIVQAFLELGAKHLIIVHWGTFRLGDEPVHFPPIEIRRELKRAGLLNRLVHLNHGQTLFYDYIGNSLAF